MLKPEILKEGEKLEEIVLGESPVRYFDPDESTNDVRDNVLWNKRNLRGALLDAKDQIDHAEKLAANSTVQDIAKWKDVTSHPIRDYSRVLYHEFCNLIGVDAGKGCGVKFYNSLKSVSDRLGADFFLEINPSMLSPEKFGNLRQIRDFIYVTGDVTLNEDKAKYKKPCKADRLLFFERLPEKTEEQVECAMRDAQKMAKAFIDVIADKLGRTYTPPIRAELDRLGEPEDAENKPAREPITRVAATVHKRTKKVVPDLSDEES